MRLEGEREAWSRLAPGGFELQATGAFFGWVRYPFAASAHEVVRALVREQDVAVLPGSLCTPSDERYPRFSAPHWRSANSAYWVHDYGPSGWRAGAPDPAAGSVLDPGKRKGARPSRVVSGVPGPCHARPIAAVLTKGSAP